MSTQKILHVISSMNPELGGVTKAVETIALSLQQENITNHVLTLDNPNANYVNNQEFKIYALGRANNPWDYSSKLLPWLKNNAKNYKLIVIHGLWLYNAYAVHKAIKYVNKKTQHTTKYYVMPHGMLDPYFQKTNQRRLKAMRNWLYWKVIEQRVVNHAEALLFTCEEEKELAHKPFKPYKPKNEIVVGLGVEAPPKHDLEMDKAFFKQCPNVKGKPYLLFLSRIHEKKGVDILLEAYAKVLDAQETNTAKWPDLVIAGPGLETNYGKSMQSFVATHKGLKQKVHFPGMVSGNTKWGAFYNSEAFILPSHQENFGIVNVEALACKKPILISDKINIWKEISNSKAGFVANDTVQGTLMNLKKWMALSKEENETLKHNAQQCYKTYFALTAVVNNWKTKVLK